MSSFGESVIKRLHHFERCVVMRRVVEREVSVVVLLGGAFGVDFEEEFFDVEWTFFPGGEVQCEVSVVIGDGGCFGVGFEECFGAFDGGAEGGCGVEGEVSAVVFDAGFMSVHVIVSGGMMRRQRVVRSM